jgi:hypothetical protein
MEQDNFLNHHLHETGESYFEHLAFTLRISAGLTLTALVIVIHGLMPFIFIHTGSRLMDGIHRKLAARRGEMGRVV